ncbi:MAG: indole-3-glycerol phosphate synthase TrpC [Clostridiales bacterium]|jgi:indole-3-glycerol phosphate synthase|nr:indole-3-glycerol phosphate synthase TrpC [Clostridiales bacterium]
MILDEITRARRLRIDEQKARLPLAEIIARLKTKDNMGGHSNREAFAFERAIEGEELSFICEVKRASPSRGIISETFPYLDIARSYQEAGAAAISVLTEADFFHGSDHHLTEISRHVTIPVLRKDFIIDEYQIYETRMIGADALLLICALLDTDTLKTYLGICEGLGLSALVEAHSEEEIESAIRAGARIIGVNNRDLKTFEVDINHCISLRDRVPKGILYIAESGITDMNHIRLLRSMEIDAALVGEALMKCRDIKGQIARWRES